MFGKNKKIKIFKWVGAWRMWEGYEKYNNPHILHILIFFVISKFFEVLFFMTIILCKDYHGFGNVEFMEIISKKNSKIEILKGYHLIMN